MSRSHVLRLADMVECCERVLRYTAGLSHDALVADERTLDAVLRNLEILGEAAKGIPSEVRARHPAVEWRKITALRDVLSHGYFALDTETIWNVVTEKVPGVLPDLRAAYAAESGSTAP